MKYVISIIVKAHLYIFIIIAISYIIEKVTGLKLIVDNFLWKKNSVIARGAAIFNTIFYFLFSLGVLLYNVYVVEDAPESYTFWKWLVIMIPLSILFWDLYYTFQGHDPKKGDDDYT